MGPLQNVYARNMSAEERQNPGMTKRAAPYEAAPVGARLYRYDARTSASSDRHAPAGTASTTPDRFAVSRTMIPAATRPTSTHCPPLLPL